MVLLSGKRKIKDPMQQKIVKQLFDPYFKQEYDKLQENMCGLHIKDPFYTQVIRILERVPNEKSCNLSYQFKTIIQLNPEHLLYHLLFGKTKEYDIEKMQIIQDCLNKKYTDKIKSIFTICPK